MESEQLSKNEPSLEKTEEEEEKDNSFILLLLLLLLLFLVTFIIMRVFKRRRSVTVKATQLMESTPEEVKAYKLLFNEVDSNGSGHITTTELHKAMKTFSGLPVDGVGRVSRQISILDVEKLRKKVDVDNNILIEFDEFVNIFKLEKIDFAEKLLREGDPKGMKEIDLDQFMVALKKAGFANNPNWAAFIRQHQNNKNNNRKVKYEDVLQQLEGAVIGQE